ncbi:hypothetical protein ANCCAN_11415 [Ancylostoma caninum]|uniref:G-protein coupled receptors family 1 profile domain-containing protein n=1 Tax=Ancylostoma caninum TaxID=29170 RepID=A0A368GDX6_ANCCA|nr:hypothetical protein ANCCAN_11415 [Ancylostoma caninum]
MDDILIYGGFPPKYQCTNESRTAEEPSVALGIYCIAFGVVFISLYLVCFTALTQRDLRKLPVYKIMIFLSICDIAMLVSNSILTGFFFIKGVVFCSFPLPIYILGCLTSCCWGASCSGGLCLVFTRLVDLWSRRIHEMLFGGKRVFAMILLCVMYSLFFFFFPSPGLFNAKYYSWIYDPMVNDNEEVFEGDSSWIIAGNNLLTVTSTFALYIAYFISFLYKYHHTYAYRMASYEKQVPDLPPVPLQMQERKDVLDLLSPTRSSDSLLGYQQDSSSQGSADVLQKQEEDHNGISGFYLALTVDLEQFSACS